MKIKQEDGTEIEVFTSQEVEQKTKEASEAAAAKAVEDFKTANPDKAAEVESLKTKLQEAEEALKVAENDPAKKAQIERLRQERDEAQKRADEANKVFESKFDEFRKEFVGDTKAELLDKLSNGDADLRSKIELEFDKYMPDKTSKKDIKIRMEKAYQLVKGQAPAPGVFDGGFNAGDRGDNGGFKPTEKKTYNQNELAIGAVLGVTEEDRANYEKFQQNQKRLKDQGLIPS